MQRVVLVLFAVVAMAAISGADPARLVTIASASDDSGETDPAVRKHNADTVRQALEPAVAAIDAEARRLDLEPRQLDVSIVRLDLTADDTKVYISSELRVVISDAQGQMLTMLASSATIEVPVQSYRPSRLLRLRDQALENASAGLADSLRSRLLRARTPNA